MPEWDSAQYLKFADERTQPAVDLANRIRKSGALKVADVGCGPGNSTGVLARRFPAASILGIDSSPEMIRAAKEKYPRLSFRLCDAGKELLSLGQNEYDIVFSNACIQWIPDHRKLLANMVALLKRGGVLAVQMPMNYEEPIHRIIGEVSRSETWSARLPNKRIFYHLTQGEYFDLLSDLASDVTLWQTTYFHRMHSHADIMEWYRGTGLRPYLEALPETERADFEKEISAKLPEAYPKQQNGEILFRFPRFFFLAVK